MAGETKLSEVVIDTSVVVKWYSEETYSEKANILRDCHITGTTLLIAPDLILYEIANALRYTGELEENEITESVIDLFKLKIELITPDSDIIQKTVYHALKWNITIYDASYIALAELLRIKLITADDKLFKKTKKSGYVLALSNHIFGDVIAHDRNLY